jgi:hypothetical protein
MHDAVCDNCFTEPDIQAHIRSIATTGDCDFCGAENTQVANCDDVIDYIRECIRLEYRPVDDEDVPFDSEEDRYIVDTFDAYEIFQREFGGLPTDEMELKKRVLAALGDQLWCQKDWTMLSREEGLSSGWRVFCHAIKHETRYLFFSKRKEIEEQDREFVEPAKMLSELGSLVRSHNLFRILESGSEYFRVRWNKDGMKYASPSELGPPPIAKAKQSRMSAAGIPMFYLATKPEIALAEVKETERGTASFGKFKLLQEFRVLDLVSLPGIPSIFDSGAADSRPNLKFLRELVEDVSKPINRDDNIHFEYTPTQVVTEYFRRMFRTENGEVLDGVLYPSSRDAGENLVLFYDRRHVAGIDDDLSSRISEKRFELISVDHKEFGASGG